MKLQAKLQRKPKAIKTYGWDVRLRSSEPDDLDALVCRIGLPRFQSRIDSGEVDAAAGRESIDRYLKADSPFDQVLSSFSLKR